MTTKFVTTNSPNEIATPAGYRERLYGSYRSGFKGADADQGTARLNELYGRFLSRELTNVLELGAGTGEVVEWLGGHGVAKAWGVDFSAEQVAQAVARGRAVREANLFEALAGCADASLDGIIALDVLEHLTRDQLVLLADEVARVLVQGGAMLVQVPNGHAWRVAPVWSGDLTHETLLTDQTLAQLFVPTGMRVEAVWGVTAGRGKPTRAIRTALWKIITLWPKLIDTLEAGRPVRVYERVLCAIIRK
ncbi:MAG: class I SAM-dependent methyltransferase [Pyrinomonadaceae bacterium]